MLVIKDAMIVLVKKGRYDCVSDKGRYDCVSDTV